MENQQNKTTWPQSSDMDRIPALSSIREPPPHSPGSSKVWLSLLCSYLSAFGLREDERHFGSSLMGGAASRKASAFAARLNVFSREMSFLPTPCLIFPLLESSPSTMAACPPTASGIYQLLGLTCFLSWRWWRLKVKVPRLTCGPRTWRWRREDQKFMVIFRYMTNSRLAWAIWDVVSGKKKKTPKWISWLQFQVTGAGVMRQGILPKFPVGHFSDWGESCRLMG